MWIENHTGVLLNLDNLDAITTIVRDTYVVVVGMSGEEEYPIATLQTKEQAMRFLSKIGKEMATGKEYIIANVIKDSIERDQS